MVKVSRFWIAFEMTRYQPLGTAMVESLSITSVLLLLDTSSLLLIWSRSIMPVVSLIAMPLSPGSVEVVVSMPSDSSESVLSYKKASVLAAVHVTNRKAKIIHWF